MSGLYNVDTGSPNETYENLLNNCTRLEHENTRLRAELELKNGVCARLMKELENLNSENNELTQEIYRWIQANKSLQESCTCGSTQPKKKTVRSN